MSGRAAESRLRVVAVVYLLPLVVVLARTV